jgi:hypothetical protein
MIVHMIVIINTRIKILTNMLIILKPTECALWDCLLLTLCLVASAIVTVLSLVLNLFSHINRSQNKYNKYKLNKNKQNHKYVVIKTITTK